MRVKRIHISANGWWTIVTTKYEYHFRIKPSEYVPAKLFEITDAINGFETTGIYASLDWLDVTCKEIEPR